MKTSYRVVVLPGRAVTGLAVLSIALVLLAFSLVGLGRYLFGGSVVFEVFAVALSLMIYAAWSRRASNEAGFIGSAAEAIAYLTPRAELERLRRERANDHGPAR